MTELNSEDTSNKRAPAQKRRAERDAAWMRGCEARLYGLPIKPDASKSWKSGWKCADEICRILEPPPMPPEPRQERPITEVDSDVAPQTLAKTWAFLIGGNPEFDVGSGQSMFYVGAHVTLALLAAARDQTELEALIARLSHEITDWFKS